MYHQSVLFSLDIIILLQTKQWASAHASLTTSNTNSHNPSPAETLGDPYPRQVPLLRIPKYHDQQARLESRKKYPTDTFKALPNKYPTDTFPGILSVKPKRKHTAAALLNTLAPQLTGGLHIQYMYMKSPPQQLIIFIS